MPQPPRLAFVAGSPRSGSTLLERILESHSRILGGPEPHLMTPLAHLGLWAKAERAPYDIHGASDALRAFVDALPHGDADYYAAVRAYADTLYGRWQATKPDCAVCLDKTPAYSLILPFLERVYPDAAYIVLTRHPVATFASYAQSFFDGNFVAAQAYNPILERYVPALADFLRQGTASRLHIRYEDLVSAPEAVMPGVCGHLGVSFEPEMLEYGRTTQHREGLGDPIGVARHARPVTSSVDKWAAELLRNPGALQLMEAVIARLDPKDLATLGYPLETLWEPLETAREQPISAAPAPKWNRYRLQRVAIVRLRSAARRFPPLRFTLERMRRACAAILPPV